MFFTPDGYNYFLSYVLLFSSHFTGSRTEAQREVYTTTE